MVVAMFPGYRSSCYRAACRKVNQMLIVARNSLMSSSRKVPLQVSEYNSLRMFACVGSSLLLWVCLSGFPFWLLSRDRRRFSGFCWNLFQREDGRKGVSLFDSCFELVTISSYMCRDVTLTQFPSNTGSCYTLGIYVIMVMVRDDVSWEWNARSADLGNEIHPALQNLKPVCLQILLSEMFPSALSPWPLGTNVTWLLSNT